MPLVWRGRRVAFRIGLATVGLLAVALAIAQVWAFPWIAAQASAELERRLGVPVEITAAGVRLPSTIVLDGIRSQRGNAERASVDLDLRALLSGRRVVERVVVQHGNARDLARASWAELRRQPDGSALLTLRGVQGERVAAAADSVSAAFGADHSLRELSVYNGKIEAIDGLDVSASIEGDRFVARFVAPVARGTFRYTRSGELDADLRFDGAPLVGAPVAHVDLTRARVRGTLRVSGSTNDLRLLGDLAFVGLTVAHPAIASAPLRDLAFSLAGDVRVSQLGRRLQSQGLTLRKDGVAVSLSGVVDLDGHSALSADLPRTPCDGLLVALAPMLPTLDGLALSGEASAHVSLVADSDRVGDLSLSYSTDVGCVVDRDPPLADPARLQLPFWVGGEGGLLREVGSRMAFLDELPVAVVGSFLAAEDARFFDHAGFDPFMIRRALAFDLGAHAFIKGASTITQQLARNLFLDGERTLSRKLEEAFIAWRLEQVLTKAQMLELYLNVIEIAPGSFGLVDGSHDLFAADPRHLGLDDAARLAALAPAPRRGFDEAWSRRYRDLLEKLEKGEGVRQIAAQRRSTSKLTAPRHPQPARRGASIRAMPAGR